MKKTQYPGLSLKEPPKDKLLVAIFDTFVKTPNWKDIIYKRFEESRKSKLNKVN